MVALFLVVRRNRNPHSVSDLMLTPQPAIEVTVNPPKTVLYGSVSNGGVFSFSGAYFEKCNATTSIGLIDGAIISSFTGTEQVLLFPNASLDLG